MVRILVFTISCLSVLSPLRAEIFDEEADQYIQQCIASDGFLNVKIAYRFHDRTYPIYLIHNPTGYALLSSKFSFPEFWSLAMIAHVPLNLVHHLENLMMLQEKDTNEYYVKLRGYSDISPEDFATFHPAPIATAIDDPEFDERVKEIMSSNTFANQVLYYYLNGTYYKVRILYNPERRSLSASKSYHLESGSLLEHSISWNDKYGIIVDKMAPAALIDHLSQLIESSWWDWYLNFTIYNGAYVKHTKSTYYFFGRINYVTTRTYTLDSWFDYTENLY